MRMRRFLVDKTSPDPSFAHNSVEQSGFKLAAWCAERRRGGYDNRKRLISAVRKINFTAKLCSMLTPCPEPPKDLQYVSADEDEMYSCG